MLHFIHEGYNQKINVLHQTKYTTALRALT